MISCKELVSTVKRKRYTIRIPLVVYYTFYSNTLLGRSYTDHWSCHGSMDHAQSTSSVYLANYHNWYLKIEDNSLKRLNYADLQQFRSMRPSKLLLPCFVWSKHINFSRKYCILIDISPVDFGDFLARAWIIS